MKKVIINIVYAASLVLILSSCGSSKKMTAAQPSIPITETPQPKVKTDDSTAKGKAPSNVVPNVVKTPVAVQYLSSKVKLSIPSKGVTLDGTMKMKSDERVQLSIVMPIFHNELMKAEITPDEVLIIDRIHKQYVRASRSELAGYLPKNSDFVQLVNLLEAASKPGGKSELTGDEIGFKSMRTAKVELYDFSSDVISVEPSVVSSKYKQVSVNDFMNVLKGMQQ